jgi:hypothetical protein
MKKWFNYSEGGGGGGINIKYLPIVINYMKRKSSKKIKNKLVTRRRSMHGGLTWGPVQNSTEYKTLLEEKNRLEAEKNRLEAENASIKGDKAYLELEGDRLRKRLAATPSDLGPPAPRLQTQPTIVTFDFKLLKKINDFPFLKFDESAEDVKSVEGGVKTYHHTLQSLKDSTQAEQNIYNSFKQGTFNRNSTVKVVDSKCNIIGFVECLQSTTESTEPTELLYLDIKSDSTANYVVLTKSTEKSLPNLSKYYVSADGTTTSIRGFSSLRNK